MQRNKLFCCVLTFFFFNYLVMQLSAASRVSESVFGLVMTYECVYVLCATTV